MMKGPDFFSFAMGKHATRCYQLLKHILRTTPVLSEKTMMANSDRRHSIFFSTPRDFLLLFFLLYNKFRRRTAWLYFVLLSEEDRHAEGKAGGAT
jgi:hypothetical protein